MQGLRPAGDREDTRGRKGSWAASACWKTGNIAARFLRSITDNVRKLQAVFTAVTQEVGQESQGQHETTGLGTNQQP